MRASDIESKEEELNEQRKAEHDAAEQGDSVVDAVSRTADALLKPLVQRPVDPEDLEEQREENDREQRPES